MLPVEILPVQETIVLRARGSELLILPHHVKQLKSLAKPRDFSQYFRAEALVNRPARKLFEAWLRKDNTLWPRLYQTIHKEMDVSEGGGDAEETTVPAAARSVPTRGVQAPAAHDEDEEDTSDDDVDSDEHDDEDDEPKAKKAAKAKDEPKAKKADKPEKTDKKVAKAKDEPKAKKADKAEKVEKKEKKADKPAAKADKAEKKDKPKKDAKPAAKGEKAKAKKKG